jgi:26S proteasome regulatory subunit N6
MGKGAGIVAGLNQDATLAEQFEHAEEVNEARPEDAMIVFKNILSTVVANGPGDEEEGKLAESSIYKLGRIYTNAGDFGALSELMGTIRPFFDSIPKAKTAKIVRTIIDMAAEIAGADAQQMLIKLCEDRIEWCKQEKRAFLRQRIEFRLAGLYLDSANYGGATKIINPLLREVKRIDDKALLVEIQLLEARVNHRLKNNPKCRASLTSARTTANGIYVPPLLQAEIDMMAGILCGEEKDYKTAYSYFYEAFEGFNTMEDSRAVLNLKYMLLCKVMTNNAEDVQSIVNNKTAQRCKPPRPPPALPEPHDSNPSTVQPADRCFAACPDRQTKATTSRRCAPLRKRTTGARSPPSPSRQPRSRRSSGTIPSSRHT